MHPLRPAVAAPAILAHNLDVCCFGLYQPLHPLQQRLSHRAAVRHRLAYSLLLTIIMIPQPQVRFAVDMHDPGTTRLRLVPGAAPPGA